MPKEKRKWQPREIRLVDEFLVEYYPGQHYMTRVRLGSTHPGLPIEGLPENEKNMLGVWRRWADAVVFMPDHLILIEGAIRPSPGDISLLEVYEFLIPHTPELAEWRNRHIEKVLVYALEDPLTIALARQKGIKVIFFRPPWINDYLKALYHRERRAPLTYPLPEKKIES